MTRKTIISTMIMIILVPLSLLLGGCLNPNGTAKPDPVLADLYLKKAKVLEGKGYLTEAHEQYKLALAVDPNNASAALRTKTLTRNFTMLADKHFKLAVKYNEKKKFTLARKALLTALKYQPNHQKAYEMLIAKQPASFSNYVKHALRKDRKTATPVAKTLKSDKKKPQPAKPATEKTPLPESTGEEQTLKTPLPDSNGKEQASKTPLPESNGEGKTFKIALPESNGKEQAFANRDTGIELYNKGNFKEAIFELNKAVVATPGDLRTRFYLSRAYFQNAQIDFNKGNFLAAKKGFESALEYNSQCEKCAAQINRSAESYKETHYSKGLVYYTAQQLVQAVNEWKIVHELDPDYKDVAQKLRKAQALLKKLKEIKKSQQSEN